LKFTTGNTVVSFGKMWYLQKAHAGRYAASSNDRDNLGHLSLMIDPIIAKLRKLGLIGTSGRVLNDHEPTNYITHLIRVDARNYTYADEFVERNKYFFDTIDRTTLQDTLPELEASLGLLGEVLTSVGSIPEDEWNSTTIRETINNVKGTKSEMKAVHEFIRWALAASRAGPSSGDSMEVLGKLEAQTRLDVAYEILEEIEDTKPQNAEKEKGVLLMTKHV